MKQFMLLTKWRYTREGRSEIDFDMFDSQEDAERLLQNRRHDSEGSSIKVESAVILKVKVVG